LIAARILLARLLTSPDTPVGRPAPTLDGPDGSPAKHCCKLAVHRQYVLGKFKRVVSPDYVHSSLRKNLAHALTSPSAEVREISDVNFTGVGAIATYF
jgi:hypothetical protein